MYTGSKSRQVPETPESSVRWEWGWTKNAEIWNGRLAMVGFSTVLLTVLACS
jgi:hypothetical protein